MCARSSWGCLSSLVQAPWKRNLHRANVQFAPSEQNKFWGQKYLCVTTTAVCPLGNLAACGCAGIKMKQMARRKMRLTPDQIIGQSQNIHEKKYDLTSKAAKKIHARSIWHTDIEEGTLRKGSTTDGKTLIKRYSITHENQITKKCDLTTSNIQKRIHSIPRRGAIRSLRSYLMIKIATWNCGRKNILKFELKMYTSSLVIHTINKWTRKKIVTLPEIIEFRSFIMINLRQPKKSEKSKKISYFTSKIYPEKNSRRRKKTTKVENLAVQIWRLTCLHISGIFRLLPN